MRDWDQLGSQVTTSEELPVWTAQDAAACHCRLAQSQTVVPVNVQSQLQHVSDAILHARRLIATRLELSQARRIAGNSDARQRSIKLGVMQVPHSGYSP